MTFVGFDLHKRYITACAMDASGAIIAEIRQLSTALEAVLTWLGALPGPVTVGMEATLYWEWLATRLAKPGHTVQVAHAFHVKLIWQARAKTEPHRDELAGAIQPRQVGRVALVVFPVDAGPLWDQ